jgi:hypothetical protein
MKKRVKVLSRFDIKGRSKLEEKIKKFTFYLNLRINIIEFYFKTKENNQ